MKFKKLYPLVTVKSLAKLKDFYSTHFGCSVSNETAGYLHFAFPGGGELAFMTQDAEAPQAFSGKGLTLCLEVANVDAEAARLAKADLPIIAPLQDNPWGDRSIIVGDPIGIHVYVYQTN